MLKKCSASCFHSGFVDDDMEINAFIEDVQTTSFLVESATYLFLESKQTVKVARVQSIEEKYLAIMKDLQFGRC
jgi:hypothetical protein